MRFECVCHIMQCNYLHFSSFHAEGSAKKKTLRLVHQKKEEDETSIFLKNTIYYYYVVLSWDFQVYYSLLCLTFYQYDFVLKKFSLLFHHQKIELENEGSIHRDQEGHRWQIIMLQAGLDRRLSFRIRVRTKILIHRTNTKDFEDEGGEEEDDVVY